MMTTLLLAGWFALADGQMRTMRVDYFHTGASSEERFSIDTVVLEGAWPGHPDRMVDETNLGKYQFQILDEKTGHLLYSRGFASIFGEWETTAEAKSIARTFHESLRFPAPQAPVKVVLLKRDAQNKFRPLWSAIVDPANPSIDRTEPSPALKPWAVLHSGEPPDKVDLLLIGDGYTAAEMEKWRRDARRMADLLFAVSPFKEHKSDFNVWAIDLPAEAAGVSRPSDGVYRHSPVRATYDVFGSERYVLTFDNKRLREAASATPYDFIEIVVNDRKYGGGGIFNLYATVAADNAFAPYIFVHEFGHHFAGLADEYYTSDVAYESPGVLIEPWEPNVTADPQAQRWKDLIRPGTPLPTPWPKDAFEAGERDYQARRAEIRAQKRPEKEMEELFARQRQLTTSLLGAAQFSHSVGAFEGAMYQAKGYYRPQTDCIMFSRDEVGFCAVCRQAIERIIELYAHRK